MHADRPSAATTSRKKWPFLSRYVDSRAIISMSRSDLTNRGFLRSVLAKPTDRKVPGTAKPLFSNRRLPGAGCRPNGEFRQIQTFGVFVIDRL